MKKIRKLTFTYLYYLLVRQSGSPYSIATAVAIGVFTGFVIPIGGQVVVALVLAFMLRANKLTAIAATMITNPYTVPFIYPAQCYFGSILMGDPLDLQKIDLVFKNLFTNPDWETFLATGQEFLVPFFIGGFVLGVVSAFLGYFAAYGLIDHYRTRRKRKLNRKLASASKREEIPEPSDSDP
jgi:uncharacterized protein (DUF2062 family)